MFCVTGVRSPYNLINVLGHFSVICNHEVFAKLNLPIFVAPMSHEKNHENISICRLLKVMCPCKYSCVYTLSKYADKTLTKKAQAAGRDW